MTINDLIAKLQAELPHNGNLEIKVWLPGSRISLTGKGTLIRQEDILFIEGNLDPGSALRY